MPCRLRRCQGRRGCLCPKPAATGPVYAGVVFASEAEAELRVAPLAPASATLLPPEAEEALATFRRFDLNGDGTVSRVELIRVLQNINAEAWSHSKCCQLFAALDMDQDQEVDFEELFAWLFSAGEEGQALRVMIEQPPPSELSEPRTEELLEAAMESLVPADEAMHPQRARIGTLLMQEVQEVLLAADAGDAGTPSEAAIREIFFDSMPRVHAEIQSIERVMQPELLKMFLEKVAEERSCVELTFHGTPAALVPKIMEHGLTSWIRKTKRITAVYGEGAYVGTHAGIAHRYAMPDDDGIRHMFCVLADTGTKMVLGRRGGRNEASGADRLVNPTQYVLVEDDRLAVTHVIRYRTTGKLAHSAAAHDRALSEAMARAGEQVQRKGHR